MIEYLPELVSSALSEKPEVFRLASVRDQPRILIKKTCFEPAVFRCPAPSATIESSYCITIGVLRGAWLEFWTFCRFTDAISTLRPGRANEHLEQAGEDGGGAFSSHPIDVDGHAADVFLGFIHWESAAARENWYDELPEFSGFDFPVNEDLFPVNEDLFPVNEDLFAFAGGLKESSCTGQRINYH